MIAPAFDLPVPELHEDYALEEAPMPTIEPDRPLAAPTPELRDETGFDIAVWISPPDPIVVPERWLPAPTPTIAEALTTPAPELVLALPLSSPVPVIATELHPPALKLREDRALEAPAPRVEPEHALAPPLPVIAAALRPPAPELREDRQLEAPTPSVESEHALAPPLPVIAHRLPTPPHIEQERRLKEAAEFEAKRREARETAAYDRLTGALTADTAQAAGEALIESKAGHASAHPWIPGIGRQASARAVTELEKHVQRFHIAKRHRRKIGMSTRETTRYLDAVKDAIEGWRRWWTHTGLFGGESRGEGIVRELGRAGLANALAGDRRRGLPHHGEAEGRTRPGTRPRAARAQPLAIPAPPRRDGAEPQIEERQRPGPHRRRGDRVVTPASKAQLTRMLATFASAGDVDRFDVGALNHGTDQMSLREDWNRGQVWRAAGWMAARNATGSSIYVRPARALEAHPWALIDDLTAQALEKVRTDHPPAIVVETSPGNYQAWIRVQRAVPVEIRTAIARTLAQTYGGDLGGVGGHQFGRCPGTTNQKPTRRLPDGRAPFAALRHAGSEIATVEIPQSDTHPAPAAGARGGGGNRPHRSHRRSEPTQFRDGLPTRRDEPFKRRDRGRDPRRQE